MKVVVLGAGPAGLAAAQGLVDGGAEVVVLEAAAHPGGLAKSHHVAGHWADLGPHRLHEEASPRVQQLVGGAAGLMQRPRAGCIHLGERSVAYPLKLLSTLRGLGVGRALQFAVGAVVRGGPLGLFRPARSYSDEARRRVGGPVFRAIYAPAARKIWGRAPELLDAAQAQARVGPCGPLALLARLVGGGEPGRYLYPAQGANGLAYEAWAKALAERGVTFCYDTRADAVEHDGERVLAVRAHTDNAAREASSIEVAKPTSHWTLRHTQALRFGAERVISTLALPRLLACLQPALPAATATAAEALRLRTVVILYVVLARTRLSDKDVHYFADEAVPFARLTEQAAFGRTATAPTDQTVIALDFYDDPGGPFVRACANELLDLAWPHLQRFGVARSELVEVDKRTSDDAYPVLSRGYGLARNHCLDALAQIDGLLSTGRGGLFAHINQHHAIETGLLAADLALQPPPCARRWRQRLREFESWHVVD